MCKGPTFLLLSRGLEESRVDGLLSLSDFTTCIGAWKYPCPVVPFTATHQHKEEKNRARLPHSFSSLNSIFKSSSVLERLKFTAFFYLILYRYLNPGSIFCSKYLLKASLFTALQYHRPPVKSMAPLQARKRIMCQFTCALILACSRSPFSSQPLLLQQHSVLSRNLDF